MVLNRKERIRKLGSPEFSREPSISANSKFVFFPKDNEPEAKYQPFDNILISNNSSSNVRVKFNQRDDRTVTVPSNSNVVLDETDILPFHEFSIEELSGNPVSQGSLTVSFRRSGYSADKQAQEDLGRSQLSRVVEQFTGIRL